MESRRKFLLAAGAAVAAAAVNTPGRAQTKSVQGWPTRAVTVISPSGAGGPSSNFRLYTDELQSTFGQAFVVENSPGASGAIALNRVFREAPDGHTLLLASSSNIVLAPLVVRNFGVGLDQFEPIASLFRFRFLLLANPELKVRSLDELINYSKRTPGKLSFGSPGVGTGGHLVSELMVKRTGIDALHIPYKSAPQQMMDTVSGALQFTFDTIGNARGMIDNGKLVPLAVTGATRSEAAPQIPTLHELGFPGFENLFVSIGVFAKKGISPAIIEALNTAINRRTESKSVADQLRSSAYEIDPLSAQAYASSLAAERETWSAVVKEIGLDVKG